MITYRVERIRLEHNHPIGSFCHLAKNLYNAANYNVRQSFIKEGKWVRRFDLQKSMRDCNDYRELPAQSSQAMLKQLDDNWKAFFGAIREYKKHPEKFKARPRLPNYIRKDGETVLSFTNQQCYIEKEVLKFPKKIGLEVQTRLSDETKLKEVRIVPIGYGYVVEIVYEKEFPELKPKKNRVAAIDIGLVNLAAMVDNTGGIPVVVKGGAVKAMNQFYNKERSYYRSINAHQRTKSTKRTRRIDAKRSFKLNDYFHKTSRRIVDLCDARDIDTLVIGHNDGWKQGIELGKRNNQNFVSVPFNKLIHQLTYKAQEKGIEVVLVNESHTSKCSFLDKEKVCHHEKYKGNRFKRGLFRSKKGTVINADVNGAYNILKKAIPKAFADGIEGVRVHPMRLII